MIELAACDRWPIITSTGGDWWLRDYNGVYRHRLKDLETTTFDFLISGRGVVHHHLTFHAPGRQALKTLGSNAFTHVVDGQRLGTWTHASENEMWSAYARTLTHMLGGRTGIAPPCVCGHGPRDLVWARTQCPGCGRVAGHGVWEHVDGLEHLARAVRGD